MRRVLYWKVFPVLFEYQTVAGFLDAKMYDVWHGITASRWCILDLVSRKQFEKMESVATRNLEAKS